MSPAVVLVGAPGSGKSTVGAIVAGSLGLEFRDTDSDVEATAGMPISDIFVEEGEPRFRELEAQAVRAALDGFDGVLALGGGAILDVDTRAALHGHLVVLLDVAVDDAARRVGLNQARPLLLGNPRANWVRLMNERRPLYDEVATDVVTTDARTPEEVAADVVRIVHSRGVEEATRP